MFETGSRVLLAFVRVLFPQVCSCGSSSGACRSRPHSLRSSPLAPATLSPRFPEVFDGFLAAVDPSDFSGSRIIGYRLALPMRTTPFRLRAVELGVPRQRTNGARSCQGLRPCRAGEALALAHQVELPSVLLLIERAREIASFAVLWLACTFLGNSSRISSRMRAHHLGTMSLAIAPL